MSASTIQSPRSDSVIDGGVAPASLSALAGRRVYFAHQSVGGNILDGVQSILRDATDHSVRLVETHDPSTVSGPAFVHFAAGRNEDIPSKNADFLKVLDARPAPDGAIALLKYCYIDVKDGTDIAEVFRDYQRTVAEVRRKHPDVTIVHVTMPLTTDAVGPKAAIKRLLGKPTARERNLKRSRFNAMLKSAFAGEPLFDLAGLESTRPDGSREHVTIGSEDVFALVPDYTNDGGHLNVQAQRVIADSLLKVLASVPVRR